jgi:NADPH:quinone reductase-like Zn-dependent oxidoreductase
MFAIKLARAMGVKVILSSSSDSKLEKMRQQFSDPPISTVNYTTNPNWHEQVLELSGGVGVDLVIEIGGSSSMVKSLKCTRRGGIVSVVGYLSKDDPQAFTEFLPVIIDRRIVVR